MKIFHKVSMEVGDTIVLTRDKLDNEQLRRKNGEKFKERKNEFGKYEIVIPTGSVYLPKGTLCKITHIDKDLGYTVESIPELKQSNASVTLHGIGFTDFQTVVFN